MKDWKDCEDELVRELFESCKDEDAKKRLLTRTVGEDIGFTVGDTLTVTGAFFVREVANGNGASYPVAVCHDPVTNCDRDVPIKQLMGLASLRGYETSSERTFKHEFDVNGEKKCVEYTPDVKDGYDVKKWQPSTRNYVDFLAKVREELPKGTTVTFYGTAVRPYKARRSSGEKAFEQWQAGYSRCITQNLWLVDTSTAQQPTAAKPKRQRG